MDRLHLLPRSNSLQQASRLQREEFLVTPGSSELMGCETLCTISSQFTSKDTYTCNVGLSFDPNTPTKYSTWYTMNYVIRAAMLLNGRAQLVRVRRTGGSFSYIST